MQRKQQAFIKANSEKHITKKRKGSERIDSAKKLIVLAEDYIGLIRAEKKIKDKDTKQAITKQIDLNIVRINELAKEL